MNSISEPAREIPVVAEVDLCVVGGSCTGVFAAVAAARLGLRVAVIEALGFFGGVAAAGLVNVWHTTFDARFKQPVIGGLTREVLERLRLRRAVNELSPPTEDVHYVLNTEELKIELDQLAAEAGVRAMLHTRFVQPVVEAGRVVAAIVEDKSGRRAVRAAQFIDASGDGDLVTRAGLPTTRRDDLQPPTMCAVIRGLKELAARNPGFELGAAIFNSPAAAKLPRGFLWHRAAVGHPEDSMVAGTRVPAADCSDADQLTRAEIEGRRQVRVMCDILRRLPGGEAVALVALPSAIGIRETRQAACLHTVTEAELLSGTRFPDAIANGCYRVDVHHSDKPGLTFRYLDGRERYVVPGQPSQAGRWRDETPENPTFYQVPYRSLVPRRSTNVLVAGRLVDSDRGAYGALRVMVNCNQTGEAAGTAAYLAHHSGITVSQVDPTALRQTMAKQGSIII